MLSLGALAFAVPWALIALAAVPIIWWLLRVTPPAPRRLRFPAIRLLFRLQEKEDTPSRTPWWLLLLRISIVVLLILGLAHPLLNPGSDFKGDGPLVLVIDDGWAAGPNWDRRRAVVGDLLDRAEREERKVILLATTPRAAKQAITPSKLLRAADAKAVFQAMLPNSWPVDHEGAAAAAKKVKLDNAANIIWLSDGLTHKGTEKLVSALTTIGRVTVLTDAPSAMPVLLMPARLAGNRLVFEARRVKSDKPVAYFVRAGDEKGRRLARRRIAFKPGETRISVTLELPSELRNRVTRIDIERHRSAGGTLLLDERLRRRPVGLVALGKLTSAQPLLSDLYYLQRALAPYSEIRRGRVSALLQRPLSVIFLTDQAPVSAAERKRLAQWVADGGVLVRFAGPTLAARADALVPVKLRSGNRSFGGAMSWTRPQRLAKFPETSPFSGLRAPRDVTIKRQVLAEPGPELGKRTWARLADGTPIVTAVKRDKGLIILFHTTANADWSNLALSGLFVEMLQRAVQLSRGVAAGEERAVALSPHLVLDGLGRLVTPAPTVLTIQAREFAKAKAGPDTPPGFYGKGAARRALNLSATVTKLELLADLPGNVARGLYNSGQEVDLKPWLLLMALVLLLVDFLLSFFLRGLVRRPAPVAASLALAALFVLTPPPTPSVAQTTGAPGVSDGTAIRATKRTIIAYVETGDAGIDRVSKQALTGLGRVLFARTSVEPGVPQGVNLKTDELTFYPVLYWPVTPGQARPGAAAIARLQAYLKGGGMIVFDIRNQGPGVTGQEGYGNLQRLTRELKIPALQRLPEGHVLSRTYYLLQRFPGRYTGGAVWVARKGHAAKDGVSSVIIGSNDWGGAWAIDGEGRPLFPTVPGGYMQREHAYRAGVNIIMYALTGNYKSDQVHIPTILRRLGQ